MRDSVAAAFVGFTSRFEGMVATMYLDVKGLVSVGIGNLIDPVGAALDLPFVHVDGTPASRTEIGAEWRKLKLTSALAQEGWQAAAKLTTLHLTPEGIERLVQGKLGANEAFLIHRFPDFEVWPADAQLGLLSMAWACGPGFHFPHFEAACLEQDWTTAASQCHMEDSHNPGLRPRNAADVVLFTNAAKVQSTEMCADTLYWPKAL